MDPNTFEDIKFVNEQTALHLDKIGNHLETIRALNTDAKRAKELEFLAEKGVLWRFPWCIRSELLPEFQASRLMHLMLMRNNLPT